MNPLRRDVERELASKICTCILLGSVRRSDTLAGYNRLDDDDDNNRWFKT